ncbi:Germ cell nuclear acidic protein [Pseudolycoriella hygida]|uniref:Germ cell nuclear acidic protein n=1 Tax=Pseudolycoriella hygida TaxID=35572 RepID=A0A9Q0MIW5_9DIPT|nr:Germ cell nuclear acidic protein [Pseudolycoriella hygida]
MLVLTNMEGKNSRTPIIQDRFRKLTLQSPNKQKTPNIEAHRAHPSKCPSPMPNLAIDKLKEVIVPSPKNSQVDPITNKLMLSTSSTNCTEQTNFINVETVRFTNPLRISNSENMKESSTNSTGKSNDNEVSRMSADMFSEFSFSSESLSLPQNRILMDKENIENISQRISNIHMTDGDDLPDTLPNTAPDKDTLPNTPHEHNFGTQREYHHFDRQENVFVILSSDDEDQDGNDLLTEDDDEIEEEESVIEISDSSFADTDDHIPRDISAPNTQNDEISDSVEQRLNLFFDNVPDFHISTTNKGKNSELDESINISETICSPNENLGENLLPRTSQSLQASEELFSDDEDVNDEKNESSEPRESSIQKSKNSVSRIDAGENGDSESEDGNGPQHIVSPSPPKENSEDKQLSLPESTNKSELDKINIRLSGFTSSTNSVDSDGSYDESLKKNEAVVEEVIDSPKKIDTMKSESTSSEAEIKVAACRQNDGISTPSENLSIEIDEISEKLLNKIYKDTWKTPQLMEKCVSTKKKCLTDRNILPEFHSTLIHNEEHEEDSENLQNSSSKIIRPRRKVRVNRILDYSSDDTESDEGNSDSQSDNDFDLELEPGKKPKRKRTTFLDLTLNEVIEEEDHENPDASAEELEKLYEKYLENLQPATDVKTPKTTKRKLFTPNYDDQVPFDDVVAPPVSPLPQNKNVIELKTPVPSFLLTPQFKGRPLASTEKKSDRKTPASSSTAKKTQAARVVKLKRICGFLESLDAELIPIEHCHPDAIKFREKLKRDELVTLLMKYFNEFVFNNQLINVPVSWSNKLSATAGFCRYGKKGNKRKCLIELSAKLCCKPDRIRDTLIHELCHAAVWIVDGELAHHGKVWKNWTRRANEVFPTLPKITICHNYDVGKGFAYECTVCGLKSQSSRKIEGVRCSKCHGPIDVFKQRLDQFGEVILERIGEPKVFHEYVKKNFKTNRENIRSDISADMMLPGERLEDFLGRFVQRQDKFEFLGAQRKWLELIAHTCRRYVGETDPNPRTTATEKDTISIDNGETSTQCIDVSVLCEKKYSREVCNLIRLYILGQDCKFPNRAER